MATEDVAQHSRPLQHDAAPSKSTSLQPRSRTPKVLEGPVKTEPKSSPLCHHLPVRPAPVSRSSLNVVGSLSYTQSTFGAGVAQDRDPLQAPRKQQDVDKEELTTKGRKRKRLAKACSACHKNKRRCDGFSPCSNCEFSARPCVYLNAQGEQIPPPRTRDSSVTPMVKRPSNEEAGKPMYVPANGSERRESDGSASGTAPIPATGDEWGRDYRDGADQTWRGSDGRPFGPIDVVERDTALSAELIDIFFKRTAPYAAMFHPATFHHRHYLGRTSPILLDAIYSLAARLCDNQAFISAYPASVPCHLRGQVFADRCRANLDRIIEMRQHWSEEEHQLDQGTWEETEFIQAALLLSVFYGLTRQTRIGLFYFDVALSVMCVGASGTLAPPSARLNLSTNEYFTLAEIRNRTFWLCVLGDICSAANGRPRRTRDHEIANIPLPGPEMHWARWGGMGIGGRKPGRRDCLAVGTGNWHSEEGQVGELGHIMRILSIFSNIMVIANDSGAGSHEARHLPAGHYEHALKAWALDLPRHLRFDEVNLSLSIAKLTSPVPEVAFAGWSFAYMHAIAECGMFYLQSKHAGTPFAVQRQGQAIDNLTVVIDSLGERGRQGPLMLFPIITVTCWIEHLASSSPNGRQNGLEERLNLWWEEVYREWGWERRDILEQGMFPNMEAHVNEAPSRPPVPAPALSPVSRRAFYGSPTQSMFSGTSPRPNAPESSSSAASHNVATPTESSYPANSRYPALAPLAPRPREREPEAHSFRRSPSPSHGHHLGDREPIPHGYRGAGQHVDREWDHERDADRHSPRHSPRHVEKEPRQDHREAPPRALAAPVPTRHERVWAPSRSGGPLLGIDALVSAAEEHHRRESLEKAGTSAITA